MTNERLKEPLLMPVKRPFNPAPAGVMPTNEMRAVYKAIKADLADNEKAIITPGFLRMSRVLGQANRYDFAVLENQGAARPAEVRLKLSDAFYVTAISVYVAKQVAADPDGSAEPHTWANPLVFTGADQPAVAAIMNTGRLRVEIDGVVYLQGLDLFRFRQVGTAQEGLDAGAGGLYGADAWNTDQAFQGNTPVFRLNGGSSNEVSVLLNQSVNATAPVGTDVNLLYVHMHGFLAQNAGQFNPNTRI